MAVELIAKVQQKNNGDFKLLDVDDLDSGDLDVVMQLISGGSVRGGAHATAPVGEIVVQKKTTTGPPDHVATEATLCWNSVDKVLYASNGDGTWEEAAGAGGLPAHLTETEDAHDASAVSVVPFGSVVATDAQAALEEVLADAEAEIGIHAALVDTHHRRAIYTNTDLVRYVSPLGDDTYDGLSPERGFETLAAAYADILPYAAAKSAAGGREAAGRIEFLSGKYDVAGLPDLDKVHALELVGFKGGVHRPNEMPSGSDPAPAILYDSGGSRTELLKVTLVSTAINGYGWVFRGLCFELAGSNTAGVRTQGVSLSTMEDCVGNAPSGALNAFLLESGGPDDNSWWKFDHNTSRRMGVLKIVGDIANNNYWNITRNFVSPGTAVRSSFDLKKLFHSHVSGNYPAADSGNTGHFYIESGSNNVFESNWGESGSGAATVPAYYVTGSFNNIFIGGRFTTNVAASLTGVFIHFTGGATGNMVFVPFLVDDVTVDSGKTHITDDDASKKNVVITAPNIFDFNRRVIQATHGISTFYKSGVGAEVTDADLTAEVDGTLGVAYDSSADEHKIMFRSQSAWHSLVPAAAFTLPVVPSSDQVLGFDPVRNTLLVLTDGGYVRAVELT